MESSPGTEYARLAVLCGLRLSEAIRDWAQEAEQRIPAHEVAIDPRRAEARTAPAMFQAAPVALGADEE